MTGRLRLDENRARRLSLYPRQDLLGLFGVFFAGQTAMKLNFWTPPGAERLPTESRRKLGTVALLYFIQGSPPAILWEVLPVYFRIHGVSLMAIGGFLLLAIPYSLQVFLFFF